MKHLILSTALAAGFSLTAVAKNSDDSRSTCASNGNAAHATTEKNIVETALEAGSFQTLAAALQAADLVEALSGEGPFTVFAPTDDAFAALPEGTLASLLKPENKGTLTTILTYHVVSGAVPASKVVELSSASALNGQRIAVSVDEDGVKAAGANVVKTDIECSNGIIHVVDRVMMPETMNLVEKAVSAGSFNTLAAALKAADLVEALSGEGPFTVFAPTDEAFAALPEGTLASLLEPENKDKLAAILTYHVVAGRAYSDQLENGAIESLQGSKLTVRVGEHGVTVGDATVASADIDTTNGVIHVIDRVLLPE